MAKNRNLTHYVAGVKSKWKASYLTLRGDSTERPRRAQASLVKMSQMSAHWFASNR